MKKLINEKMYDTETAELIGSFDNGEDGAYFIFEELYHGDNGYFIHGEGGCLTVYYGNPYDFKSKIKEDIVPLDDQAAKDWAIDHLGMDDILKHFTMEMHTKDEEVGVRIHFYAYGGKNFNGDEGEATIEKVVDAIEEAGSWDEETSIYGLAAEDLVISLSRHLGINDDNPVYDDLEKLYQDCLKLVKFS